MNWWSPASIVKQFGLRNRSTVYRHAHALGLFSKRQRNVRAALEKIIERAGEVEVNATAVVNAVAAYSRINAAGQWVERSERIDLNHLFDRMTALELEQYARDGKLRLLTLAVGNLFCWQNCNLTCPVLFNRYEPSLYTKIQLGLSRRFSELKIGQAVNRGGEANERRTVEDEVDTDHHANKVGTGCRPGAQQIDAENE